MVVRRRSGWGLALFAACLLVLQSVASAFASGEMPVSRQLDAFGNPLCISEQHSDTGDHNGGHNQPADCCLLGCSLSLHLLAATADAGWILQIPLSSDSLQSPSSEIQFRAREHRPGYPRAPPTLIA